MNNTENSNSFRLDALCDLSNHTIFITGAAGQLGSEIVNGLLLSKSKVVASDKNLDLLKEVAKKNAWDPNKVLIKYCDIVDRLSIFNAMNNNPTPFSHCTSLITNAGVSVFEDFLDRTEDSINLVMDVNLKGTLFCIQEFIKHFNSSNSTKEGSIVNIASHYGIISPDPRIYTDCERKNSEIYGATKSGVIQMTKYFAVHASKFGLRTNSISPGGILNDSDPQGKDFQKNYNYRCPLGRMGKSHEVVGSVIFLISRAASYINGHNLVIDGGTTIW